MKNISLLLLLGVVLFASCSSTENKLVGIWKVEDVKTDFNESNTTPKMLQQIVEIQKQMYFKIRTDSVMVIISNNNTYEAVWSFDKGNQVISYHFKNDTTVYKLGDYVDSFIITKSLKPFGVITTTYSKE
jgi:hypothetical protein